MEGISWVLSGGPRHLIDHFKHNLADSIRKEDWTQVHKLQDVAACRNSIKLIMSRLLEVRKEDRIILGIQQITKRCSCLILIERTFPSKSVINLLKQHIFLVLCSSVLPLCFWPWYDGDQGYIAILDDLTGRSESTDALLVLEHSGISVGNQILKTESSPVVENE